MTNNWKIGAIIGGILGLPIPYVPIMQALLQLISLQVLQPKAQWGFILSGRCQQF